jgi:hypothetical protein
MFKKVTKSNKGIILIALVIEWIENRRKIALNLEIRSSRLFFVVIFDFLLTNKDIFDIVLK